MATQQTRWAVLYCKFSDNTADATSPIGVLQDINYFKKMFTKSGIGTHNMVDFFRDVSHGSIDIRGSEVFNVPPFKIKAADYGTLGNTSEQRRVGLVKLAKDTANASGLLTESGVMLNTNNFYGVVVCLNVILDTFGLIGKQAAVLDSAGVFPSIAGQEMGHGYGLEHSKQDGSNDPYKDEWDVMSTWNGTWVADNPDYYKIGPGLNAANMRAPGWLDESRVWRSSTLTYSDVVELRPLHRYDLPGLLAAQAGTRPYLVEFRVKESWDSGIRIPVILIHRFENNCSYIMASKAGRRGLVKGDVFEVGREASVSPYTHVEVLDIDAAGRKATVRISHREAEITDFLRGKLDMVAGLLQLLGGEGWGWFVAPGGGLQRVPPGDPPFAPILEQLAAYKAAESFPDIAVSDMARRSALTEIARRVESAMEQLQPFRVPAPGNAEESPSYEKGK